MPLVRKWQYGILWPPCLPYRFRQPWLWFAAMQALMRKLCTMNCWERNPLLKAGKAMTDLCQATIGPDQCCENLMKHVYLW